MLTKKSFLAALTALSLASGATTNLSAQDINNLVLYSQHLPTSTSRSVGMGGAMGAVGGDFSTLSTNPGGLGLYRSGDLGATLNLGLHLGSDTYRGNTYTTPTVDAKLGGLALVINFPINRETQEGVVDFNFGVAYNQLANYHGGFTAKGENADHSFLDALVAEANDLGLNPSSFGSEKDNSAYRAYNWYMVAARKTFLFEPIDVDGNPWRTNKEFKKFITTLEPGDVVEQRQSYYQVGHLGEIDISGAINVSNRLFLGLTLGVQEFDRKWEKEHFEKNILFSATSQLDRFKLKEEAKEEGLGVNLKLGAVLRASDYLRFGLAFHSPTAMSVESEYEVEAEAYYKTAPNYYRTESPEGETKYSFYGPMRAMGSMAVLFGSHGLISADYIYSHNPLMAFSNRARYTEHNELLQNEIKGTHEVRAGLEILTLPFVYRLGGGYLSSAYSTKLLQTYGARYYASAGFGMAVDGFYFDIAYRHLWQYGEAYLYKYQNIEAFAKRRDFEGLLMATIGFRW